MGSLFRRSGAVLLILMLLCGCKAAPDEDPWLVTARLDEQQTPEELYQNALREDVLVVYTVTTRAAETKEAFEAAYPGLAVELRDLRSPDLIGEVERDHRRGAASCDIVLCNDNSGDLKERLVDTGIVIPWLPEDISEHLKEGMLDEGMVTFVNEAELLLYSTTNHDRCPVDNLWALTEPAWRGRIYMPNPLRSFSTYALCGGSLEEDAAFAEAYREYAGEEPPLLEGGSAAVLFWTKLSENVVFTNSSDEVVEALNDGSADFGFAVSSKLRLRDVGYRLAPVWQLKPFAGARLSFSVMLAHGARNVNAAKLFIRFLFGEADGQGAGYRPFCTAGTWSARDDVADGNPVPLDEIALIVPSQHRLIEERASIGSLWAGILKNNLIDAQ